MTMVREDPGRKPEADSGRSPDGEPGQKPDRDLAASVLLPQVYDELRRLARSRMARERPGQTLTPTALVHEAYLRLVGKGDPAWQGRAHFFGAAAEAMRRILIERARRYAREKHGGGQARVTLDESLLGSVPDGPTLIALDDALTRLEAQDPEMAAVVKLHQFAGLTLEETAAVLESSDRTVSRRWTAARAWLRRELSKSRG
jgi:RNA polymerase sigma factor (TIGR02999 family)